MSWNNLYKIKKSHLLGIALSIPIVIFVLVWVLNFDDYTSDLHELGIRILVSTLILFAIYGFIIFRSGFTLRRIGLTVKNAFYGILYAATLYLVFHLILFLLTADPIQNPEGQTIAFIKPKLPFNMIGLAIFFSVIWEEFVYRAFLLPQFQLSFRKSGFKKSVVLSILATQVIFALHHLSNRIFFQDMGFYSIFIDQIMLVIIGAIFCMIYILSENLTYTVMVHLFMDFPILFISGIKAPTQYLSFIYLLAGLIGAFIIFEFRNNPAGRSGAHKATTR